MPKRDTENGERRTQKLKQKIELLAPAGNFECLAAAVQSGADAVYLSGKSFGARSFADNFDDEELKRAIDYCHIRGVKVHVTVNTLVSDREFSEAVGYLEYLYKTGADAVIVQDVGVAEFVLENLPDMEVHASTQMTIHNSDGVLFAEALGIKRTVLSRELSIKEISAISEKTGTELEVFGHGALCMCYSGQCLMSSIIGGRSGNRGKCAQPCRLMYSVGRSRKKAFYMSLKDLNTLGHIRELEDIGVASLKIEGRMKGAAYVAAAVRTYRKYIDNPSSVKREDVELIESIFNRGGFTDGYLTGKHGAEMFAFDKPDNPYRREEADTSKVLTLSAKEENRKLTVDCRLEIKEGAKPTAKLSANGITAVYTHSETAETAQKNPITAENTEERFRKTGGTPFEFGKIDIKLSGSPYLAASELNAIRRGALELFGEAYTESFRRKPVSDLGASNKKAKFGAAESRTKLKFVCEVTTLEQYKSVENENFEIFYAPLHLLKNNIEAFESNKKKTVIVLPSIIHEFENESIKREVAELIERGFRGVSASNAAQVYGYAGVEIFGGFRLNIFNGRSLAFYAKHGVSAAELSPELTLRQISALEKPIPVQVMAYGRLPLMVTENCVLKNGGGCPCGGMGIITDRMGMEFPVIRDGDSCRSVILNSKKTFMADNIEDFRHAGVDFIRLYFTDEGAEECGRICGAYLHNSKYCPKDFTRAHYYNKVL